MPTAEPHPSAHGPIEHGVMKGIQYTSLAIAGFSLIPFVLPMVGIGANASNMAAILCGSSAATSPGIAGAIAGGLSHIPLVGGVLAAGGLPAVAVVLGIGVGGLLLGNYLEKKGVTFHDINIGKVIRWTALATSMLCALPLILGGISMAMHFLGNMFQYHPIITNASNSMYGITDALFYQNGANVALGETLSGIGNTIGSVAAPTANGVLGTLGAMLTCCLPVGVLAWMSGGGDKEKPDTRVQSPILERARETFASMRPSLQVA